MGCKAITTWDAMEWTHYGYKMKVKSQCLDKVINIPVEVTPVPCVIIEGVGVIAVAVAESLMESGSVAAGGLVLDASVISVMDAAGLVLAVSIVSVKTR